MRILLIHPGHDFSTNDVFDGLKAGIEACGVEVVPYPLNDWLETALVATKLMKETGDLFAIPSDAYAWAAAPAVALGIWKECTHLVAVTGSNTHISLPMTLRKAGMQTALVCTESPYMTRAREQWDAVAYDHVFTNERTAVPLFAHNRPGTVHYLPHAYNPAVHMPGPVESERVCDVYFVGTAFEERKALFDGMDWEGITFVRQGPLWRGEQTPAEIVASAVPNHEVAASYRAARISLNHHRTTGDWRAREQIRDAAESLGPRAYEIPACRGFMLSDDSRAELRDVFGGAVPTYKAGDSADLERQIRYWLAYPDERERKCAAQHAAVQPHTWTARAKQLLETIA